MELPSTKVTLTCPKDQRSSHQVLAWHTVGALQMVPLFSQGPLLTECRKHVPPAVCTSTLNPMLLPPASQNNCLATVLHSNGRIRREPEHPRGRIRNQAPKLWKQRMDWPGRQLKTSDCVCKIPLTQLTSSGQMCVSQVCVDLIWTLQQSLGFWPLGGTQDNPPRMLRASECGCPSPSPWSYLPDRPRGLALALGFSMSTGLWTPQCPVQRGRMCSREGKTRPGTGQWHPLMPRRCHTRTSLF